MVLLSYLKQTFLNKIIFFLFVAAVTILPLLFVPWIRLEFELPKAAVFRGLVAVIWGLLVVKILIEKRIGALGVPGRLGKAFWVSVVALIVCGAIACALSWAPWVSFFGSYLRQQGFLQFLFYILFFLAGVLFFERRDLGRISRFIGLGAVLVCVIAVMQRLFGGIDYRIFGTMGHPNFLGSYLVIAIPFLVGNCVLGGKKARFFWIAGLGLAVVTLFLTFSRAAILGLFVEFVLMILIFWKVKIWKKIAMILIGILAFSGIFVGAFFAGDGGAFSRLSGKGEGGVAISTRLTIWPWAVGMVLEKPVFGYGQEMFEELFERKAPESFWELEKGAFGGGATDSETQATDSSPQTRTGSGLRLAADRAHNEILDVAAGIGIAGLLAYLCVFLCVSCVAWRGRRNIIVSSCFVSLVALFATNMFGFSTTVHYVLWWMIVAMVVISGGEKEVFELGFLKSLKKRIFVKMVTGGIIVLTVLACGWAIFNFSFRSLMADYKYMQAANEVFAWKHLDASDDFKKVLKANPYEVFYAISAAEHALLAYEDVPENEKSLILGNARFFINYAKGLAGADWTKVVELEEKCEEIFK